jgi:hypothetical protein
MTAPPDPLAWEDIAMAERQCQVLRNRRLESRWYSVPYEAGIAAEIRMAAETPPNADRFTRAAHNYSPCSLCLHDSRN